MPPPLADCKVNSYQVNDKKILASVMLNFGNIR